MRRPTILAALTLVALAVAGCSSSSASNGDVPSTGCPTTPIPVTVSVDQWGDIASQLAGACGDVTTVIKSSSIDPHGYEPTSSDIAAFSGAGVVVVNGVDYDAWATKALDGVSPAPTVVNAGNVVGRKSGDNPHLWYSPTYVYAVADAITAALKAKEPAASQYFDQQAAAWRTSMKPYDDAIAAIKAGATGKTYGATEGVFDYMAEAVGLVNKTPQGWQNAAANSSDPAPGDVAAFTTALTDHAMAVLVYNTQTEGALPQQVKAAATSGAVPVVDVTETVAPGSTSFEQWQVTQLTALAAALGVKV